ncbi:hypothetical protein Bhyg_06812, partial [Pseudolycoriella hygida]
MSVQTELNVVGSKETTVHVHAESSTSKSVYSPPLIENTESEALSSADNMVLNELKPLEELGVALPSQCELNVAKKYVTGKRVEHEKDNAARM